MRESAGRCRSRSAGCDDDILAPACCMLRTALAQLKLQGYSCLSMARLSLCVFCLSLPLLCCLISFQRTKGELGQFLLARSASTGRTRSGNYLKMTPNYQCKVSWSRLPSANITKKRSKQEPRKWKFKHCPRLLRSYLGQIALFRFDFLPRRQLLVCHSFFFMGKKEISLSRSWLTLSQHTHTHKVGLLARIAGVRNGLLHRCWRLLSMMKCIWNGYNVNIWRDIERQCVCLLPSLLLMMANWIGCADFITVLPRGKWRSEFTDEYCYWTNTAIGKVCRK